MGNPRSSANLFTNKPHNPQQVLIKGSTMTFENGQSYDLNDPDLQYFITNTQFDREINNIDTIYSFLNDIKYNINYGDKNQRDIIFFKKLYSRYHWGNTIDNNQLQGFAGSGLQGCAQGSTRSHTNQYVFLSSDPYELVDQIELLYFEKVGGNDSFQLNDRIIAIVDKLLEYECITTNQHQNMRSNLISSII